MPKLLFEAWPAFSSRWRVLHCPHAAEAGISNPIACSSALQLLAKIRCPLWLSQQAKQACDNELSQQTKQACNLQQPYATVLRETNSRNPRSLQTDSDGNFSMPTGLKVCRLERVHGWCRSGSSLPLVWPHLQKCAASPAHIEARRAYAHRSPPKQAPEAQHLKEVCRAYGFE